MCGVATLFHKSGAPVSERLLVEMRDTLTHRGPDDAGVFVDGPVGLSHRRLSIIDLGGGHQPMGSADGSVQVVFNGEIYNFPELREHLESRGRPLVTRSDTETIVGLYELYGEDCVDHLRGMFAFVLWDAAQRKLVAARDRIGIKPLYVAEDRDHIAFASEIKALLRLPWVSAECNRDRAVEYLTYRHVAGDETLFRGIRRVAPGEIWSVTGSTVRRRRYWEIPTPTNEATQGTLAEWSKRVEGELSEVVGSHMLADVPLGTFNSGGVDSSLVTAIVAGKTSQRLNTYSVGFDDPAFDERAFADLVAHQFSTRHHAIVVPEQDYADALPLVLWHHDEPLDHPHTVHLTYICRLARERVKVVLTGEGSDELFGGYPRYRLPWMLDRATQRGLPLGALFGLGIARLLPARSRMRMENVLGTGSDLRGLTAFAPPEEVRRVLAADVEAEIRPVADRAEPPQLFTSALAMDQATYLQSLLTRLDRVSMATSLEARVPFLDHGLIELAARVPSEWKIRRGDTKFLIKHIARQYLPSQIVDRKKAGFAVPISDWLQTGVLRSHTELLLEPRALSRGLFDDAAVRRVVEEHRSGLADHGELLWGMVNLELWHRVMIDGRGERPAGSITVPTVVEGRLVA